MSRKLKNLFMSLILIMFTALDVGTILCIKNADSGDASSTSGAPEMGQMGEAPSGEAPSGTPPEMSSGDNSSDGSSGEAPSGTPPVKPGETSTTEATETTETTTTETSTTTSLSQSDALNLAYIALGIESVAIAGILIFLAMSGFNAKSLDETFEHLELVALYIFLGVLGTIGLVALNYWLTTGTTATVETSEQQSNSTTSGAIIVDGETKELTNEYASSTSDESVILVRNSGNLTLSNATLTKSGDSSNTENSEFYGTNAALLATAGSTATVSNTTINTSAKGANAIFATGENAKITISNSTINSTGASSARGLDATYGGTIEADNVKITTQGGSCATLATDRGEGTVIAKNSTLETNGAGSPIIYSTGDISIENTQGTANGAQIAVIEGKNSATITSSNVTASAAGNRGDVDIAGVMLYQSMSGDANEGTASFTARSSELSIASGSDYYSTAPMFFVTNTDAEITLDRTTLNFGSGILLNAAGTSEWGASGSNGGNVTLTAMSQELTGNITADKISTVALKFTTNTTFNGAINPQNTAKSASLELDSSSQVTLTADSYVTSFTNANKTNSNINFNGHKLYVNGTAVN